jgi:hypothetical protein
MGFDAPVFTKVESCFNQAYFGGCILYLILPIADEKCIKRAVSFICTLQVKYGFHNIGYCETLTYLTALHGEICYTESRQFRLLNVEITGKNFFTLFI